MPRDMALVGPYMGVYYLNFLIARYVEGGKHLGLPLVGKILSFKICNQIFSISALKSLVREYFDI